MHGSTDAVRGFPLAYDSGGSGMWKNGDLFEMPPVLRSVLFLKPARAGHLKRDLRTSECTR